MSQGPPPQIRAAIDHLHAGRLEQAGELLRIYLRRNPNDDNAQFLLGNVLSQQLQDEPAIYALQKAAAMRPGDAQRWVGLGVALLRGRGAEAAVEMLRACPAVKAGDPHAMSLLGDVLEESGRAGEAVPILRDVIARGPGHVQACRALGTVLVRAGHTDEAIECFRRAAADNDFRNVAAYCFHINYSDTMTPAASIAAHRRFYQVVEKMVPAAPPVVVRQGGGPLRVGFVSAEFFQHSVAYFIGPIFEHLDRSRFRVIAVSASSRRDDVTDRLRAKADEWVDASVQDPKAMMDVVRRARPDVLIDLGGLTGQARVVTMAHRIAPVQATYLGYPNTSGVPNVDWRVVETRTDPPGEQADGTRADELATERLMRMEGCFVCYLPPEDAPAPVERAGGGPVTFGSFNTSQKMSPRCVKLWSAVLRRVEGSQLVLKRREFGDPWIAAQFVEAFGREGVDASRLRFLGKTPSIPEHLAAYGEVDIALDSFPYHGTTTTCEALWMGVPVVSRIGNVHASRVGLSLLSAVGMEMYAAGSDDAFVQTAAALAGDRRLLGELRRTLRERVKGSMLCDGAGFAARFGRAIEQMWALVKPA